MIADKKVGMGKTHMPPLVVQQSRKERGTKPPPQLVSHEERKEKLRKGVCPLPWASSLVVLRIENKNKEIGECRKMEGKEGDGACFDWQTRG